MKKISSLIFLFVLTPVLCFSQIKFSAKTGIIQTDINEILWDKTGEDAQITSFLDWKTYIAPVISINAEYKTSNNLFFGLNSFYTIPVSYGVIEDFDYMNVFSTGGNERTHYSNHTNNLDYYWNAELLFGASGNIGKKIELSSLFSLEYLCYSFSAFDGYKQYGTKTGTENGQNVYSAWNDEIPKVNMQGKLITLEAQKLYFGIGTCLDYYLSESITVSLLLKIKPSLLCIVEDTHYKRNSPYNYFELGSELAFDSALLLEYKLNKKNALTLSFNFSACAVNDGKLYISQDKNEWIPSSNPCGLKEINWKVLLGYTFIYEN